MVVVVNAPDNTPEVRPVRVAGLGPQEQADLNRRVYLAITRRRARRPRVVHEVAVLSFGEPDG